MGRPSEPACRVAEAPELRLVDLERCSRAGWRRPGLELAGEMMALATLDDADGLKRLLDAACRVMRDRAAVARQAEALPNEPPANEA